MLKYEEMMRFYNDKKILITGHTGFKGSWLCMILKELGAEVVGYSLEPPTNPSLFSLINIDKSMQSYIGDIRDLEKLQDIFHKEKPEIVIHMAAQPLVRESYKDPILTYQTNVMGTVNVLECIRKTPSVKSVINVTTDKVYRNNEWDRGYIETDFLDGFDPYSNSKSCSELVTHSYINSFLLKQGVAVSTCRAGNVIGGGDFAEDRIIPDCVRAAVDGENIIVRNPKSIRPYQHVLEPLFAYLMIAIEQYSNPTLASSYNVGPEDDNCVTTGELVNLFCESWKRYETDSNLKWVNQNDGGPHEANFLKLDCAKLKSTLNWQPKWSIETAIDKVCEFESARYNLRNELSPEKIEFLLCQCIRKQIKEYIK